MTRYSESAIAYQFDDPRPSPLLGRKLPRLAVDATGRLLCRCGQPVAVFSRRKCHRCDAADTRKRRAKVKG